MKMFWWQGGLHIEPETKEERVALALLLDSAKITSIAIPGESAVCTGVLREQPVKLGIADTQL